MVRVRLAALAVSGSLLFLSGCATSFDLLHPTTWFGRNCTDCEDVVMHQPGCATGACPGGPLLHAGPTVIEGPNLFPPNPTPILPPGATMPPATASPRPNTLPQIVTVPQATRTPSPP